MKLLFPNGEHPSVVLTTGVAKIGSGELADIKLTSPGIVALHCQLNAHASNALELQVLEAGSSVMVNGQAVTKSIALKPGDLLSIQQIHIRIVAIDRHVETPVVKKSPADQNSQTLIRQALPKITLRGVSGSSFGKVFPIVGTMIVGRGEQCDICIAEDGVSRRHAKLMIVPEGILVEDLGSANGTFVNNVRIHQEVLRAGGELRLDTLRFLLEKIDSSQKSTYEAPSIVIDASKHRERLKLYAAIALLLILAGMLIAFFIKG